VSVKGGRSSWKIFSYSDHVSCGTVNGVVVVVGQKMDIDEALRDGEIHGDT